MVDIHIIPQPKHLQRAEGFFTLKPTTQIIVSPGAEDMGHCLRILIQPATGYNLRVVKAAEQLPESDYIALRLADDEIALGKEGYSLTVQPERVVIRAQEHAGLFYGLQTLRQMLPPELESDHPIDVSWFIPAVVIEDAPRFPWRGMHLDVGRHMFPVDFIKRFLDLLALHKFNVFHWHLTEDQGWRIEIKKYPRLTEIGAHRAATPLPADQHILDGVPYSGYYTQAQVKEIVAYAAERFITVVPEIELPGHSVAALASYPELGCTGGPYEVRENWGIAKDVYCAGNDKVFDFLQDVLSEVMELFPSPIIHIGGDECPKDRWEVCPKCQSRIAEQSLADEHELQSYFICRIEAFLNAHGRRIIGWDEILEGGLAPNASVMSWQGIEGGIQACRQGHDVVMTPTSHCYFDYYQSENREEEPPAIGGFIPLEHVYAFEPIPIELSPAEAEHVLGAEGTLWTEYIPTTQLLEYMAFPRTSALAEVVWSPPSGRNYSNFLLRLNELNQRLKQMSVNYREYVSCGVGYPEEHVADYDVIK
jgi:hexosaminidase